jgi:hypothetical protein
MYKLVYANCESKLDEGQLTELNVREEILALGVEVSEDKWSHCDKEAISCTTSSRQTRPNESEMASTPREPPFDINALDIASPTAADEIKKYHKFATENKALIDSMADGAEKNEWSRKQKKWTSAFNLVFRTRKGLSGKGK